MKRHPAIVVVVAALIGLSASAAADERVDKAVSALDQQFAKVKSYVAKTESRTDTAFGPGHTQKMEMAGTSEWLRKADKALMRSTMKCKTIKTEGGQSTTTVSTITTVDDGTFLFMLTEEDGQKTVMKSPSQSTQMHRPKGYFAQFKSYYDIKLLKDEGVKGNDCYVFEMKMKPMEGVPPTGRQLVYFQKDHGIQIKSESFDANEKLIASSLTKDVKINASVSEDRFKFEIPEGAQVIDQTAAARPASETATPQETQPEEEKPEKKKKKKEGFKLPKLPKL